MTLGIFTREKLIKEYERLICQYQKIYKNY